MISIQSVIHVVVTLIILGVVFGLLYWLIDYCQAQFPSAAPFAGVAKIILAILAVLVVIGILLSLTGTQIFVP